MTFAPTEDRVAGWVTVQPVADKEGHPSDEVVTECEPV